MSASFSFIDPSIFAGMLTLVLAVRKEYRSNIVSALDCLCDGLAIMEPVGVAVQASGITQPFLQASHSDISFGGPGHDAGEVVELRRMGRSTMLMTGHDMNDRGEGSSTGSHTLH